MQPLTKYLVKEFEPGNSTDYKIRLADDYSAVFMDEGTIWHWIKRAARSGLEISVSLIEPPITLPPSRHSMQEYLVIDNRAGNRTKFVVYAHSLDTWMIRANAGEDVAIHPLTCVLDLS